MAAVISGLGSRRVEAVLCANDEMALGAIEALKVAGYFKANAQSFVPVIGVDGTQFALDAISDGSLLGTVRGDPVSQGRAASTWPSPSPKAKTRRAPDGRYRTPSSSSSPIPKSRATTTRISTIRD